MKGDLVELLLPQWRARYVSVKLDPPVEVVVQSAVRPKKFRTFRVARNPGRAKFRAEEVQRIITAKEARQMARRSKKNTAVDEELEELEAAFDDEDLEDLEDVEDDEEEVEEVKPKRSRKSKAAAAKPKRTRSRKAAEPEEEDDEEEDDEEEEKPRRSRKSAASKTTAKAKSKKASQPPALVRELPAGKLGAAEVAELAGTDARSVRVFLRKNEDQFPKDEELGRYAFTKKQAQQIAKKLKTA